jgi:hypothetical protein
LIRNIIYFGIGRNQQDPEKSALPAIISALYRVNVSEIEAVGAFAVLKIILLVPIFTTSGLTPIAKLLPLVVLASLFGRKKRPLAAVAEESFMSNTNILAVPFAHV